VQRQLAAAVQDVLGRDRPFLAPQVLDFPRVQAGQDLVAEVLAARGAGGLARIRDECARAGAEALDVATDVSAEDDCRRLMERAVAAFGDIDVLVANAGVSSKGTPMTEMTLQEFRRVQRINVEGVFLTFRAAARHMAAHGQGGSLVATASTAAVEGAARNSHYGASKGAVTAYVRALAVELARHKIRVNSILPGWIVTDMTEAAVANPKFADAVLPRIPARRWGTLDDFGGIAVYLASDAAAYTTGEQFVIDGGYTKF